MTDLIAELAEVVAMDRPIAASSNEPPFSKQIEAWNFIRAHAAEIEAMARDAERYRALRSGGLIEDSGDDPEGLEVTEWTSDGTGSPTYGDALDAAIDAAMRSAKEDGK